jgi:hypothetical protein
MRFLSFTQNGFAEKHFKAIEFAHFWNQVFWFWFLKDFKTMLWQQKPKTVLHHFKHEDGQRAANIVFQLTNFCSKQTLLVYRM